MTEYGVKPSPMSKYPAPMGEATSSQSLEQIFLVISESDPRLTSNRAMVIKFLGLTVLSKLDQINTRNSFDEDGTDTSIRSLSVSAGITIISSLVEATMKRLDKQIAVYYIYNALSNPDDDGN